jgi:hypothetical protein
MGTSERSRSARSSDQEDARVASMREQLEDLYADRERLVEVTGLLTTDDIIALIDSMRTQLEALYAERDETRVPG